MPSSVIAGTYYDIATARLRIIFVPGLIYDYLDVPENVYKEMKAAGSKGTFLNRHIKGHYKVKKIK
ncbi:MAG TPA: KTSC domain-containing protein [Chitinophagaceae bacterium]|jgi:hypothetical protein